MASVTAEGEVDFDIPGAGKPCKTWYKTIGDISARTPLIAVHGGPGVPHNYLLSLVDLHTKFGLPLLFYDQVGCGRSTRLTEKRGDAEFWTEELFRNELTNLVQKLGIKEYDLLGQSWGGMVVSAYASYQPKGLRRLIISNSPASMQAWVDANAAFLKAFPEAFQQAIAKHESEGTFEDVSFKALTEIFYAKHTCKVQPMPEDVQAAFKMLDEDPTVYVTMNGPTEFTVQGSLRNWSVVDRVHSIKVPTLLINGRDDAAADAAVQPFFDKIEKVKWLTFEKSSHLPQWEERVPYMEQVAAFLMA